jgi:hypothetical protein
MFAMSNPYTRICSRCKKHPVEVIEGEEGPWTSGYCGYCNDCLAEQEQERREFAYWHSEDR